MRQFPVRAYDEPLMEYSIRVETDEVVCSGPPAGSIATTSHFGPYNQLGAAHEAVRAWLRQNGRTAIAPYRAV